MSKDEAMPWRLVIAGCVGMFAATATGSTRAPFLPDMARELGVSLPAIANLFGVTAAAWGISSYMVGYLSDRVGRRVFLIFSPACMAVAVFAAAQVESYAALLLCVVLTGICCGSFTATMLAEVSLRVPASHHGRAFGYVMSGQSLTLLFGIPLAAWLGAMIGWRGMHVALAGLALVAVGGMILGLRVAQAAPTPPRQPQTQTSLRQAMTGSVSRLFVALIAERVAFGLATFYYASYLRSAYGMAIDAVALPLVGFALGNILGTFVGGQVADRFPYRRVSFAVALALAGCIAVPWFLWPAGIQITVILGVLFAFFDAVSRPPLLAALADVPADIRGVVMGLNSAIGSIGWLIAALVGGWLYSTVGFAGFSLVMVVMCVLGALVVVPDSRARQCHLD